MLHPSRTTSSVLLLATVLTTPFVKAAAASFTFSGTFSTDDQVRLFDVALAAPASVDFRSFGYGGGTTATGLVIAPEGCDGVLTLFDANGTYLSDNDDGSGVATDPLTGAAFDPRLTVHLGAGNYILALTQYDNFAQGSRLADGFSETGNPHFTASPSFTTGSACPGDLFRDITGGAGHCRTGNWTVDFVNATNVSLRDVTAAPEPGTAALVILADFGLAAWALKRSTGFLALLLVAVGASVPPDARAQSSSFCSSVPQLQFPFWNETAGWSKPSQFETIQLADIDGDGQDELMARDADGLSVQHWNAGTLTWTPMLNSSAFSVDFSNAAGWDQPERYQSISFIDIDGDGKAELVALDANNQLLVLTYDANLQAFRSVRAASPVTLGPQTRFFKQTPYRKLGQPPPLIVVTPQFWGDRTKFNGLVFGVLTGHQLGSASDASFSYTQLTVETGDQLVNPSYRTPGNQGYFYSLSAADLDGDGVAEIIYPTIGRALNVFKYQDGTFKGSYTSLPDSSLLLAFPMDFNGNGNYNLVVSDPKGLTPYQWRENQGLTAMGEALTPLAYAAGERNGVPLQFSTIQITDLRDGKGQVVLAMLKDGLYAWGFNPNTKQWEQRTKYAAISENAGFGNYSGFGTIQTGHVRIGDDDRTIVIALSEFGLRTAWYTPGQGFQTNSTPYFPAFTGGQRTAYQYLSRQTGFSNPSDDIRAHYVNDYASISEIRFRIQSVTTPPVDVSQDDFDAVRNQLLAETAAVDTVRRFFDRTESFLTVTSQDQRAYFDTLVRLLALQNSDSTKTSMEVAAKVFKLITDLISATDPTGGAKAALTLVKDFNNIVSGAIALTDIYGKQSARGSLDKTVYAISENLLARTRKLREVNDCARSQFLANWGLMKTLTDGVQSNQIVYDSAKTAALERVHRAAYELELWQALVPTKWLVDDLCDSDKIPSTYKYVIKPVRGEGTRCVGIGLLRNPDMITITTPSSGGILRPQPPSLTALDALYKGGYGVRLSDLIFGRNGWDLPTSREFYFPQNVLSSLPQGDSPILSSPDLGAASAISPLVARFDGLAAATADAASLNTSDTDETSLDTSDPDTPRKHVKQAETELQLLLADVKRNVTDKDQRAYEVDLLTTALNYVHDQRTQRVTSDNAIAMLEAYRTSLQPTVQSDDNSDPIAQDHMAHVSVVLNLLANDVPDNAPLHHSHP